MESLSLPLILDGVILILLVATIIYAARLSLYLKKFRDSKSDLEMIITDLSKQISKADNAIATLNKTVDESGEDLQARMDRAAQMFDELELIVQSGDTMANRLEALAVKNRKILEGDTSDLEELSQMTSGKSRSDYDERLEDIARKVNENKEEGETGASLFSIRDPDIERGDHSSTGFELNDDDQDVLSEAERDLYNALNKRKSRAGGKK
jgi:ABC-type transporter Mla subunit MlaD